MVRILLLLIICTRLFGQTNKPDTVFCDCETARVVSINGNKKIGKTIAPKGPGEKQEISERKNKSKYVFEKEHHSAWYKLVIVANGNLGFDIIPTQAEDDYDFVLFKASNANFCDSLSRYAVAPIRSCISRDKEDIKGKTGLSAIAKKELVKEGVGDAYAKAIRVKKGEVYYLVLDNVYEKGDGHTIQFYFEELVNVSGVIKDENDAPVQADITLVNQKGDTVAMHKSAGDGSYSFNVALRKNIDYSMNFFNPSTFSYSQNLKLNDSNELKHLSTILPKLKKGRKYSVGSINFQPGLTTYLPQSVPSMMNLFNLLEKNKSLKILIIGHSNGRDGKNEKEIIAFTKDRAITIQKFLIAKGIDKSRIEIDGMGDHEMLFDVFTASEKQQVMNRRVEVKVLEY